MRMRIFGYSHLYVRHVLLGSVCTKFPAYTSLLFCFKLTAPPNVTTHNEGCSVCGSAGSGVLVSRWALRRAARDAGGERRGWQYLGSAGGRLQQLDELQTPGGRV